MINENAYREASAHAVPLPCVFAVALQARQAECELAGRRSLAEREVLACAQPTAHLNCEMLERLLLERATFPLRLHPHAPLTHANVMRLQCGGIKGLQQALEAPRPDVHRLIGQAHSEHGSLTDLPWEVIVQHIINWQPRRRGKPEPTP